MRFYDDQSAPDYAEPELNSGGRVPFYVQQGAGLNLLVRPLAQIQQPPPCSYLEVGCGYGFGLDYALRTRGWRSVGVDPAPLAALGRDALQLPIELRYLGEQDDDGQCMDVVAGAEVIEHLPSPAAFVRSLRTMLRPGGVLILTTPNGDDIAPETPSGILIPLLSPGLHLVIQSASSLRSLLLGAGFAHVDVRVNSHSLVAFASDAPLQLERDEARLRQDLRQHLERRAVATDPAGDPFLGFAGRAFQEAVNDGDWDAADRLWALLRPACRARFGFDLATLDRLPDAISRCGLEELVALVPMSLAGLLYASAVRRLASGTARSELRPRFQLASQAARAMRRALQDLAMEDGQTEDIGWTAEAEALLCAASAGDADTPSVASALPHPPSGGLRRRDSFLLRAVTTAVNSGHYEMAADLVKALDVHRANFAMPGPGPRSAPERDALYSLAILALNYPPARYELGGIEIARDRLACLLDLEQEGSPLWLGAAHAAEDARVLLGKQAGPIDPARSTGSAPCLPSQRSRGATVRAAAVRVAAIATNTFAVLRSRNQAVDRWLNCETTVGPKLCILAHWDARGAVRSDVLHHIDSLIEAGFSIVFASNSGRLQAASRAALQSRCAAILVRRNVGYDFAAWREALQWLEIPRADTAMVLLTNDSVYGPVSSIKPLLDAIDFDGAEVWGCTESREFDYHLQSFWMAFGRDVIVSPEWRGFWDRLRPGSDKRWIVRHHEVGLTQALLRAGFRCRAVWPEDRLLASLRNTGSPAAGDQSRRVSQLKSKGLPVNPTCELWRPLLQSGFPFLKRELLRKNAAGVLDAAEWQSVAQAIPGTDVSRILQAWSDDGLPLPGR